MKVEVVERRFEAPALGAAEIQEGVQGVKVVAGRGMERWGGGAWRANHLLSIENCQIKSSPTQIRVSIGLAQWRGPMWLRRIAFLKNGRACSGLPKRVILY